MHIARALRRELVIHATGANSINRVAGTIPARYAPHIETAQGWGVNSFIS